MASSLWAPAFLFFCPRGPASSRLLSLVPIEVDAALLPSFRECDTIKTQSMLKGTGYGVGAIGLQYRVAVPWWAGQRKLPGGACLGGLLPQVMPVGLICAIPFQLTDPQPGLTRPHGPGAGLWEEPGQAWCNANLSPWPWASSLGLEPGLLA